MTEENRATVEQLEEAAVPAPKPDDIAKSEEAVFRHNEKMQETQLGWVGRIWGSRSEKPGNISAIVALILVIYIGFLLFYVDAKEDVSDQLAALSSIVTLILGYLFGSNDSRG